LKARLTARHEKKPEKSSVYCSVTFCEQSEDNTRNTNPSRRTKAKPSGLPKRRRSGVSEEFLSPVANTETKGSADQQQFPNSTTDITPPAPLGKQYLSQITLVSDAEQQVSQSRPRATKSELQRRYEERRNEERRKKDGEKACDKHRQQLVQQAAEGGYTISEHEMNKRLDAFIKKREVYLPF
jgi:hypothetical protein